MFGKKLFTIKGILPGIIGIAIFVFILSKLDLQTVTKHFFSANPILLAGAIIVIIASQFARGYKWKKIIEHYGKAPGIIDSTKIFCLGTMIGFLTPMKIGIFIRAWFIKKIGMTKAIASIIIDRAFDLSLVGIIALTGTISLPQTAEFPLTEKLTIIAISIVSAAIVLSIKKIRKKIQELMQEMLSFVKNTKTTAIVSLLTPVLFLANVASYYFVALAIGINIEPFFFLYLIAAIVITEALPVTFLGLGTREAVMVTLLSTQKVSPEMAVALSLLYLAINYSILSIIGLTKLLEKNQLTE